MTVGSYTPLTYRIAFAALQGMGIDLARKLLDVVGSCVPSLEAVARFIPMIIGTTACNGR